MPQVNRRDEQPSSLVPFARTLRAGATDAERSLWRLLRSRQVAGSKFRRQRPFGPYILDFYCIEKRLAVEADGGQHFTPEGREADARRTEYLEQRGGVWCLSVALTRSCRGAAPPRDESLALRWDRRRLAGCHAPGRRDAGGPSMPLQ